MFPLEENLKSLALLHILASGGHPLWGDPIKTPRPGSVPERRSSCVKRAFKWVVLTFADGLIAIGNRLKGTFDARPREALD